MHIVIVDDEPKIRNGLLKLLSAHVGWEVTGAFEEAKEALKFLYENPVDVMITDIKMPELSGLDLISRIREANQEVDIVILSGYSNFTYAQRAIELGVRRYLTKPTNPKEVISVLSKIEEELNCKEKVEDERPDVEASNLIVSKTLEYIERNYSGKITLKDMADELFITPNYLCRLFKRHTGKNLMEYVTEYRMLKAQKFLKDIHYKISEISEMVGYNDTKYFSSTFKKIYGMTPLDYRNGKT